MKRTLISFFLIFSLNVFADSSPQIFDGFWKNTKESFTENGPYYLAAIGLTPVLIASHTDANVHTQFKDTHTSLFEPGVTAGYIAPFALGLPLFAVGEIQHDKETLGAAFAVAQTSVITLSTVSVLKGVTGRVEPDKNGNKSIEKQSEEFHFGLLNRGIYNGWPSGHMATISSLASTMIHYYPDKEWVKWTGYGSMAYMLATVSIHKQGQFHWFSDGIAGGLIGFAIGKTVGTNWRQQISRQKSGPEKKVQFLPLMGPQGTGLQLVWYQ